VIIGLTVIIVTPAISGYVFKQQYHSTIKKFNSTNGIFLELIDYKLGWFASELKLNVKGPNSDHKNAQGLYLTLNQTIMHSPFILHFSKDFAEIKSHLKSESTDITAITSIPFAGKNKTTFKGKLYEDDFAGLVEHSKDWSKFNAKLSAQHLMFKQKNITFNLTNPNINIISTNIKDPMFLTNQTFKADSLVINNKDQELIKLAQVEVNSQVLPKTLAELDNNYLNFLLTINMENSTVLQQTFASNKYTLELKQLPQQSLTQFQQGNASLEFIPLPLLKKFGEAETTLDLTFPKNITQSITSMVSLQIYKHSILGKVDKRQDNEIVQDIIKHIENNFQDLVNNNIFIENPDHYKLHMAFNSDGHVLVNDQVIY
jgi:hypothetical protein